MSGDQDKPIPDANDSKKEGSAAEVIHVRPKSRKELRAEKKASKKAQATTTPSDKEPTAELTRKEKKLLRKKSKKAMQKDQRLQELKEQREEKKLRKQKKLRREMNAPGGVNAVQIKKANSKKNKDISKEKISEGIEDFTKNAHIYNNLFSGTTDDATGTTTLRMGVKYIDIVEGKGQAAQERTLVNVSYKLTGGKYGAVIDSSKNFSFRLGKGEVIKGWEIGVEGMKVGGRRHLIIPPKAGYGPQDIGAGPGATLFFDISLLSMR